MLFLMLSEIILWEPLVISLEPSTETESLELLTTIDLSLKCVLSAFSNYQ